jgi:hypothetical protein
LGSSLKNKILDFEEIDFYFRNYFFNSSNILNLISNLRLISPYISGKIRDNLNYLFNIVSKKYEKEEYKNLIYEKFGLLIEGYSPITTVIKVDSPIK